MHTYSAELLPYRQNVCTCSPYAYYNSSPTQRDQELCREPLMDKYMLRICWEYWCSVFVKGEKDTNTVSTGQVCGLHQVEQMFMQNIWRALEHASDLSGLEITSHQLSSPVEVRLWGWIQSETETSKQQSLKFTHPWISYHQAANRKARGPSNPVEVYHFHLHLHFHLHFYCARRC